jgi:hypothetical protein
MKEERTQNLYFMNLHRHISAIHPHSKGLKRGALTGVAGWCLSRPIRPSLYISQYIGNPISGMTLMPYSASKKMPHVWNDYVAKYSHKVLSKKSPTPERLIFSKSHFSATDQVNVKKW